MSIPAGVILIWTGTNASIPTGWTRETTLDDKYPKAWGDSVAPNQTGGSNTHTHTGNHTHTLNTHTHTFSLAKTGDQTIAQRHVNDHPDLNSAHSHYSATTSGISGGSLQSTTVTWSSVNQEPPYYKVIFIKPTGTVAPLPAGICAHYNGSSAPILWNFCDGNNSTPDLRNKYLKGAGTGADAGGTGGGTSHVHDVSHGHTANAHSHTGTSGGADNPHGYRQGFWDGGDWAFKDHTHSVTLNNTTDSVSNYSNANAGGDTVEPEFKKLGVVKASVGVERKGLVGLWLGDVGAIPNKWALCDGNNDTLDLRDKFIKIGSGLANNNETGGANTHTHSAIAHTHASTGTHTHTGSTGGSSYNLQRSAAADGVLHKDHTHTVTNVSSVSASYSTDNITADTVDNQPSYRTVAYIQLTKIDTGASLIFNLI